jgi:predicted nucleic acid-binding protein
VRGILDTSVFIADEQGRPLLTDELPDEAAVSVVTLAELELGVHMADTEEARAERLSTLRALNATYVAVAIDEAVASAFAELVAGARRAGRRLRVQDAWIAATAKAHTAVVYTQDADFDELPGVEVVRV